MKAVWNGVVLAESDKTIEVEGNQYFPPDSVIKKHLTPSDFQSTCHWKGEASYYTVEVGDNENPDAAWYYPSPSTEAEGIKNYVAFWKGIEVTE